MRCNDRIARRKWSGFVIGAFLLTSGCASPPSVTPLLRSAGQVIDQEQQLLDEDGERESEILRAQRDALAAGFESDLRARGQLDAQWVLEGVRAHATAREMLVKHEIESRQTVATRKENLRLAGVATHRAIQLIERQDQLFGEVPDIRRWLEGKETRP